MASGRETMVVRLHLVVNKGESCRKKKRKKTLYQDLKKENSS